MENELVYKLERVGVYLQEAIIGYEMLNKNEDSEEGSFLLQNGLTFAQAFNKDALSMIKGPSFIDWM